MCIVGMEPRLDKRSTDERKEKSKDAARDRRAKEAELFQELESLLPPVHAGSGETQKTVDKTSLIRLTCSYLKTRAVVQNGAEATATVKEEVGAWSNLDLLSCLDGFTLVLGAEGEVVFVSENVAASMGLSPLELLGQSLDEFVHPCDLEDLASLTAGVEEGAERRVEVTIRMKCTVTERGRMINLNQASYKTLQLSGLTRSQGAKPVFLGTAVVVAPNMAAPAQEGVFITRHSTDMKFTELDAWLSRVAGYTMSSLLGESFYNLVHAEDIHNVQTAFRNLREQGVCCTRPYRLLVKGGGYCWVQTRASCAPVRRGSSRHQAISCQHWQVTELQNKHMLLASIQLPAAPKPDLDQLQVFQQLLEEKPVITLQQENISKQEEKLVILRPRSNQQSMPSSQQNMPSSVPTPVIMSTKTAPLKAVTSSLFRPPKPKVCTSSIFGDNADRAAADAVAKASAAAKAAAQAAAKEAAEKEAALYCARQKELEDEKAFMESLFTFTNADADLEKLSPYIEDSCVNLESPKVKKLDTASQRAPELNQVTSIGFDEFLNSMDVASRFMNPGVIKANEGRGGRTGQAPGDMGPFTWIPDPYPPLFAVDHLPKNARGHIRPPDQPKEFLFFEPTPKPEPGVDLCAGGPGGGYGGVLLRPDSDLMWGAGIDLEPGDFPRASNQWGGALVCVGEGGGREVEEPPKGIKREHSGDTGDPWKVQVVERSGDRVTVIMG